MASIVDAFNDAFTEEYAILKYFVYSLPVFVSAYSFVTGNIAGAVLFSIPTILMLFGLLTCGIYNIRSSKREIITFNIPFLLSSTIKFCFAVIPPAIILSILGYVIVTFVKIPIDYPYTPIIFKSIVWTLMSSIVATSFLSFAKKIDITAAYNLKVISESCIDVFVALLFLALQMALVNALIVGFAWYILFFFKIPVTNPIFILYCSMVVILNISVLSDYLAQVAYEYIKGNDDEYNDNYKIKGANTNYGYYHKKK